MDRATLETLQNLAKLTLPPGRHEAMIGQLGAILAHFDTLSQLPAQALAAAAPPAAEALRLRPDEPGTPMGPEAVLANAERTQGGGFLVPRVIE